MFEILIEALFDSLKTVPLLLIIYIGIELLEYKFGDKIREWVRVTDIMARGEKQKNIF